MQIEHKKFVDLLIDASGIEVEKAEEQLSKLIVEIKQSLKEGKPYQIEGFGIFSRLQSTFIFTPSEKLNTEINFKYVGMEPIELDETNISSNKREQDSIQSLEEAVEKKAIKLDQENDLMEVSTSTTEVERVEEVVAGLDSDENDRNKEDLLLNKMYENSSVDGKKIEQKVHQINKKRIESYPAKNIARNSNPTPVFLWITLLIIFSGSVIVALDYFSIIKMPLLNQSTTSTNTNVDEFLDSKDSQIVHESNQEQVSQYVVQPIQTELNTTLKIKDKYGLTGQFSALSNDGYTIILYALRNKNNAINETQKLIDAGYRGFIIPIINQQYGMLYRVCLGQFGTKVDASLALKKVENLLPENYIIKKIN